MTENIFQHDFPEPSAEAIQYLAHEVLSLHVTNRILRETISNLCRVVDPRLKTSLETVARESEKHAPQLLQQMRQRWIHYQDSGKWLGPGETVH